jgi:hypothetical protein
MYDFWTLASVQPSIMARMAPVQEVQNNTLKWWGMDVIDKRESEASFKATGGDMGICFYAPSYDGEITPQLAESWLRISYKCV